MAVILSGTTNDITIGGVSVATDTEVSSAVASGVAPKANTADLTAALALKQDLLVSGTSIKTIGGVTLLGGGDLSVAPTSSSVGTATAGLSAGSIGSYMLCFWAGGSNINPNGTIAGSSLNSVSLRSNEVISNWVPLTGTWKVMGYLNGYSGGTYACATLCLRIA